MSRPRARVLALVRRLGVLAVVLVGTLVLATGCGAAPRTSPPSGVDGLQIPTPSPDVEDFVSGIDNPWLPLSPGSVWVREIDGEALQTETVRVLDATQEVAGIEATGVSTQRGFEDRQISWYAQDTRGNVWLLAEEGRWEAGVDGALAGLAMPARPRVGDGYARWSQDGDPRDVVRVEGAGPSVSVPAGRFDALLRTTAVTAADRDQEAGVVYARDVGEVLSVEAGTGVRVELVEHQLHD